jgi:hypothetical protein
MTESTLPELLRRLHEELGWSDSLDDESRELLGVVARDIEALAAKSAAVGNHVPALERLAVRFDSDHPALSAVARQLMDALAKAGI